VSAVLIGAPLVAVGVSVESASAAPFTVSNNNDSGAGSLRAAIAGAASAGTDDVITVNSGVGTITLLSPITFAANGALTIHGNGVAIDANGHQSALHETAGSGAFSFDDFTVSDAHSTTNKSGAIVTEGTGAVAISNCTISGNTANFAGNGADIAPLTLLGGGALSVTDCAFTSNTVAGGNNLDIAGAIDSEGGPLTVTGSSFSSNKATGGTNSVVAGAIDSEGGTLTITNSSIVSNTVVSGDGGDAAGGVVSEGGAMTLKNSTVSANVGSGNGRPDNAAGGIVNEGGSLTLVYDTIVSNVPPLSDSQRATNIKNDGGALDSFGTVIAIRSGSNDDCIQDGGATNSHGFNFTDDDSCGFGAVTDITSGDPGLGAPGFHASGSRLVQLPESGSMLLDVIPEAHCQDDGAAGISNDERGVARPTGAGCDIGAVELTPSDVTEPTTTTTAPGGSTGPAGAPTPVNTQPSFTG